MNRQQRRAAAKAAQAGKARSSTITSVVNYVVLASTADATITGATLITPDGEVRYVSAETAKAMHFPPTSGGMQ